MKFNFPIIFIFFFVFISCNNNDEKRNEENARAAKKKELIFENINKAWQFNGEPLNSASQSLTSNWTEWRIFLSEIAQKPKSTMGAFQQKAANLSKKVLDLNKNIPPQFNKPEIKSRISVLVTKINSLDLFIHLNQIPDQKVIALIAGINTELSFLQLQMDEIVRKSKIQMEDGEQDMIRMLDTTRAVPSIKTDKNLPKS